MFKDHKGISAHRQEITGMSMFSGKGQRQKRMLRYFSVWFEMDKISNLICFQPFKLEANELQDWYWSKSQYSTQLITTSTFVGSSSQSIHNCKGLSRTVLENIQYSSNYLEFMKKKSFIFKRLSVVSNFPQILTSFLISTLWCCNDFKIIY